jgi:hypothetical protein
MCQYFKSGSRMFHRICYRIEFQFGLVYTLPPCNVNPEGGSSIFLRNGGIHPEDYRMKQFL